MSTGDTLAVAQAFGGSANGAVTQSTSNRTDPGNASRGDGRGRRRRRAPNDRQREVLASLEQGPSGSGEGRRGGGPRGRGRGSRARTNRPGQARGSPHNTANEGVGTSGRSSPVHPAAPGSGTVDSQGGPRRRRMMNSKLTVTTDVGSSSNPRRRVDKRREETDKVDTLTSFKGPAPTADTLAGRLIKSLRTPPFADCPICFNSIHPAQPIWCCGPTIDSNTVSEYRIICLSFALGRLQVRTSDASEGDDSEDASDTQCCWTPFHLKCIRAWATKSLNDIREAYRARGEPDKQGEWRCPGCQRKRLHAPSNYVCVALMFYEYQMLNIELDVSVGPLLIPGQPA